MSYPCCPHCGGEGDPMRYTDDPIDGLPPGCPDSPHEERCIHPGCQEAKPFNPIKDSAFITKGEPTLRSTS